MNLLGICELKELMGRWENYLEKYVGATGGGQVGSREHHHVTPQGQSGLDFTLF